MITDQKKQQLEQFLNGLCGEEIAWSSGYLAGSLRSGISTTSVISSGNNNAKIEATIIYVTETGNAKSIAANLVTLIKASGGKAKLKAAEQYRLTDLSKEKNLILITSTHGEGELPETGKSFYEFLLTKKPKLNDLNYAILSLGDSNYSLFCEAGKIYESALKDLGAKEILPKLDLDLDFEDFTGDWQNRILQSLSGSAIASQETAPKKKKSNYQGKILSNIILNDVGSSKEVHHIEIEAEGLIFEVGDALALKIGENSPRMYSIASSIHAFENEVHILVGKVEGGVVSSYLAALKGGDEIEFYISKNNVFRLPEEDKDIIMVGPGTGVAPFRGFVQERDAKGASGKNWLFFGDKNSHTDFLYQSEWQEFLATGVLTKIDVAFSRDQKEKIYVQDRIRENAEELKKWLENGAYFYICGDKANMAKDVEEALVEIVGSEYLAKMQEEGRYLKDVY
ncbi:MAG: sulfite reductase (NADPH) flavoprotein alpha-component [Rickettsiales bacterium]